MKLFSSKDGSHIHKAPPAPSPAPASTATATIEKSGHFWAGYLIYLILFLLLIAAGLVWLWLRMDAYERSRPYRPMDALMAETQPGDWRSLLSSKGVEADFLDSLDFSQPSYVKKLDSYADEHPVYSIRFGKKTMLTADLKQGEPLRFGLHTWELNDMTLVKSGLTVYAPENAILTVRGVPVGPDHIVQRNAQSVELGPLEAGRTDIPGLAKYALDDCFSDADIAVADADGNPLTMAFQKGNAYYYPPVTSGYIIEAPSAVTVTVNGIVLGAENAEITTTPLEDFSGLGSTVPVEPADLRYEIDGLLARPIVKAVFPDGTELAPSEETEDRWTFVLRSDPAFKETQKDYILEVFDAYIAFLGNRNADLDGNYRRYRAYLLPGSEAEERASMSLDSLYWVKGRDTSLDGVELGDVIRYGDSCFTAWIDFTRRLLNQAADDNSYLFIFVRYQDQWRVVRVMNKTSFIRR